MINQFYHKTKVAVCITLLLVLCSLTFTFANNHKVDSLVQLLETEQSAYKQALINLHLAKLYERIDLEKGKKYLVTAPSGKGKSTFLHILYGFVFIRATSDIFVEANGQINRVIDKITLGIA